MSSLLYQRKRKHSKIAFDFKGNYVQSVYYLATYLKYIVAFLISLFLFKDVQSVGDIGSGVPW